MFLNKNKKANAIQAIELASFEQSYMLKCIIIDDDPIFLTLLEKLVDLHPSLELVDSFSNASEAAATLTKNNIDLLLLDIEMPDISGMDLIKSLTHIPQIIFITAHREYAVEAFEFDVTDYIVKPIAQKRFLKAIEKAINVSKFQELSKTNSTIQFKVNGKYKSINENDIYYAQSYGDYIKLYERDHRHVILGTLNNMQNTLNPKFFIRVHRKFIVNINHIEYVKGYKIHLESNKVVMLSRSLKSDFLTLLKNR